MTLKFNDVFRVWPSYTYNHCMALIYMHAYTSNLMTVMFSIAMEYLYI